MMFMHVVEPVMEPAMENFRSQNKEHKFVASAEAVGGGVLIHPVRQEGEEDVEAQSFVVPVPNGIQLETRHRSQRPVTANDADAEVWRQLSYIFQTPEPVAQRPPCTSFPVHICAAFLIG